MENCYITADEASKLSNSYRFDREKSLCDLFRMIENQAKYGKRDLELQYPKDTTNKDDFDFLVSSVRSKGFKVQTEDRGIGHRLVVNWN